MSPKAVLALLVLTIALAVTTWLVTRAPRTVAAPAKLFASSDLSKVEAIELSHSTGTFLRLSRQDAAADRWMLTWKDPAGDQRWPASTSRVRGALRLLSGLVTAGPLEHPSGPRTTITFTLPGTPVVARVDEAIVSGRAAIAVDDTAPAMVDPGLHSVLTTPDPSVWRDPAAFPSPIADAARLTISAGGQELALARVGKQWAIVKPVAEPADRAMVDELLKSLASIGAQRFVPDTNGGWDAPTAAVRIEIDQRTPVGDQIERSTLVQELLIGGAGDIGGSTILARAAASTVAGSNRSQSWGPAAMVLARDAVAALSTDPATVIARSPAPGARADAARVRLAPADVLGAKPIEFARTLSGWTRDGTPISDADAKGVEALLSLVFDTRANSVRSKADSGAAAIGTISLFREDGAPIATIELAQAPQGPNAGIVLTRDMFHWVFSPSASSKGATGWVASQLAGQ